MQTAPKYPGGSWRYFAEWSGLDDSSEEEGYGSYGSSYGEEDGMWRQADDYGEVSWNSATGTGSGTWKWASCCTDGAVIGPMPAAGFTLLMHVTMYAIPAANAVRVVAGRA